MCMCDFEKDTGYFKGRTEENVQCFIVVSWYFCIYMPTYVFSLLGYSPEQRSLALWGHISLTIIGMSSLEPPDEKWITI